MIKKIVATTVGFVAAVSLSAVALAANPAPVGGISKVKAAPVVKKVLSAKKTPPKKTPPAKKPGPKVKPKQKSGKK